MATKRNTPASEILGAPLPGERTAAVADILAAGEPTAAEVNAAARDEARGHADTPPRRGPGRPKGARNRPKAGPAPSAPPKVERPDKPLSGAAAQAAEKRRLAELQATRSERQIRTDIYTAWLDSKRTTLVKGVCTVTRLEPNLCIGVLVNPETNIPMVGGDGRPLLALTQAGQMLAPSDDQIKLVAGAVARIEETPEGQRLMEWLEKYAPYAYGLAALGTVVMYAVTTLQAVSLIKAQAAQMAAMTDPGAHLPPEAASTGPVTEPMFEEPVDAPARAAGYVKPDSGVA